jgi:hypothetical protein
LGGLGLVPEGQGYPERHASGVSRYVRLVNDIIDLFGNKFPMDDIDRDHAEIRRNHTEIRQDHAEIRQDQCQLKQDFSDCSKDYTNMSKKIEYQLHASKYTPRESKIVS